LAYLPYRSGLRCLFHEGSPTLPLSRRRCSSSDAVLSDYVLQTLALNPKAEALDGIDPERGCGEICQLRSAVFQSRIAVMISSLASFAGGVRPTASRAATMPSAEGPTATQSAGVNPSMNRCAAFLFGQSAAVGQEPGRKRARRIGGAPYGQRDSCLTISA
jgi:hypothetical protein